MCIKYQLNDQEFAKLIQSDAVNKGVESATLFRIAFPLDFYGKSTYGVTVNLYYDQQERKRIIRAAFDYKQLREGQHATFITEYPSDVDAFILHTVKALQNDFRSLAKDNFWLDLRSEHQKHYYTSVLSCYDVLIEELERQ